MAIITASKFKKWKLALMLKASFFVFQLHAQSTDFGLVYENGKAVKLWASPVVDELRVKLQGKSTSIFGDVEQLSDSSWFAPLIPFNPELTYQVWGNGVLLGNFQPENQKVQKLSVQVFPETNVVPANLLKMQLKFSNPMQVGHALKHINVFHHEEAITPFLDMQPELWNEDKTVLTLWLDPGRIKRDLIRHQKLGEPLTAGESYRLVINKGWADQWGNTLEQDMVKSFRVVNADRQHLSPQAWAFVAPQVKSSDALTIHFNEPMDYLLLQHAITVYCDGVEVKGEILTKNLAQQWQFIPESTWRKGNYEVFIEGRIEDLAGNNLKRAFEQEVGKESENSFESYIFRFVLD